jgi:hypothetical protein
MGSRDFSGEFSQQYRIWLWLTLPCVMEQLHWNWNCVSCCAVEWSQAVRDVACRNSVEWTDTHFNTHFKYEKINSCSKYIKNKKINLGTYLQTSSQNFLSTTGWPQKHSLISSSYKTQHAPAALLWSERHLAFYCPLAAGWKIKNFLSSCICSPIFIKIKFYKNIYKNKIFKIFN